MKNIKRIIIVVLIIIIAILSIIMLFKLKLKKEEEKTIENARKYLINKYKIENEKLKYKSFIKKHDVTYCSGEVCFGSNLKVTIPDIVRFSYNGEMVSVSNKKDDFLVDDLYNRVREYYANKLNINSSNIFVDEFDETNSDYIDFLMKNKITEIDNTVIDKFLSQYQVLYIHVVLDNREDENNYVEKIKNNYSNLRYNERIYLHYDIFNIEEKYEELYDNLWEDNDYIQFKYYVVTGINIHDSLFEYP